MILGSVVDSDINEKRIAISPDTIKKYITSGFSVQLEKDFGKNSNIDDNELQRLGAKILNKEEIYNNHPSWFFKNIYFNQDNTLLSYYENGNYYHSHTDKAFLTCLTWVFKQPKKFEGGNLTFTDYDITIEVNTNCTVIFPSCIKHEVSKISMKKEDLDDLNGRICITQFFGLSI